ncbi:MAG: terminase small subunit [Gemmataceae bacterium]|nr:terminase small subunit [Gemmataceae bacterium]
MAPSTEEDGSAREARIRRFVDEYVIDHNGVRAYLEAFGRETAAGRPRSYNAACVEASKLLKTAEVRQEIRAAEHAIRRRCYLTADKVINELAAIAFSSMGDVFDFAVEGVVPQPKPAREIPFLATKAIQSVRHQKLESSKQKREIIEYRFHPKVPALAKIYDHLGMGEANALDAILSLLPDGLRSQVLDALAKAPPRRKHSPSDDIDRPLVISGREE